MNGHRNPTLHGVNESKSHDMARTRTREMPHAASHGAESDGARRLSTSEHIFGHSFPCADGYLRTDATDVVAGLGTHG